jgi:hypothetical protein
MITIKKAKGVWGRLGNTGSMGTGNPVLGSGPGVANRALPTALQRDPHTDCHDVGRN